MWSQIPGTRPVCVALMLLVLLPGMGYGQQTPQLRSAPAPEKELIAVLDLDAVASTKAQASAMTDRLREELLRTGIFVLVNRDQIDELLKEQAFQQTGCTSQECAVQVGKVLGVRKMVSGRVTKLDDQHWLLTANLTDVETAQTLRAESIRFEGDFFTLLGVGIGQLAAKLAGTTPSPERPATAQQPEESGPKLGRELRTVGEQGHITTVAFSPDGHSVISGGWDGNLKLWDVNSATTLRTFIADPRQTGVYLPRNSVNSVALSPDGSLALSGSNGGILNFWEVGTGRNLRTLNLLTLAGRSRQLDQINRQLHPSGPMPSPLNVTSVVFSTDGKRALSGSDDGTLKLWKVETGQNLRTFIGHSQEVRSVAFSPDGQFALSGSADKTLKLWEVGTGRNLRTFTGHSSAVNSVAFSPDGRLILSGSSDKTLKLWEIDTGKELRTFEGHEDGVTSVAYSPDGKFALSGSADATVALWDIGTGVLVRDFEGHKGAVTSVAFSPDGKVAISGSADNTLKLWEIVASPAASTMLAPPVIAPVKEPQRQKVWRDPTTSIEFVWVPGGEYEQGCRPEEGACIGDAPAHRVRLRAFWMGKTEVTQGQWIKVMGNNPSKFKMGDDYPVENVSWDDAQEFTRRLNNRSGGASFRLPTEAEWEFACRSGDNDQFYGTPSGNLSPDGANIRQSGKKATTRVASYSPNGLGLYDMSGNVWEWVQDAYGLYPSGPATDPVIESGAGRVRRGGAWNEDEHEALCSHRFGARPFMDGSMGFRLARTN